MTLPDKLLVTIVLLALTVYAVWIGWELNTLAASARALVDEREIEPPSLRWQVQKATPPLLFCVSALLAVWS